jgi:glutathione S-transferase
MIRVHHFRHSRGLRVVWQCEEMGLPYQIVPASMPASADYLALNPAGGVPFLEDEGGVAINESTAIMLYLATQYGPSPLLPGKGDPALAKVLQFVVFGEASLAMSATVQMSARFRAPDDQKQNWSVQAAHTRMGDCLAFTAKAVGDGPYLVGDRFTLADISAGYAIGLGRNYLGYQLPANLLAYHDRLMQRPAFQRAAAI